MTNRKIRNRRLAVSKMLECGMSVSLIADHFGVIPEVIQKDFSVMRAEYTKANGLPPDTKSSDIYRPRRVGKMVLLKRLGLETSDLSRLFHVGVSAIYQCMKSTTPIQSPIRIELQEPIKDCEGRTVEGNAQYDVILLERNLMMRADSGKHYTVNLDAVRDNWRLVSLYPIKLPKDVFEEMQNERTRL